LASALRALIDLAAYPLVLHSPTTRACTDRCGWTPAVTNRARPHAFSAPSQLLSVVLHLEPRALCTRPPLMPRGRTAVRMMNAATSMAARTIG